MKYDNKVYINRLFALRAGKKHNLKVKREYTLKRNNLNKLIRVYQYRLIKEA
jgi:hypothetical protein